MIDIKVSRNLALAIDSLLYARCQNNTAGEQVNNLTQALQNYGEQIVAEVRKIIE